MSDRAGRAELCDIECKIVSERDKAIAVVDGTSEVNNGQKRDKWFWLPRSQIEIEFKANDRVIITLPVWLARQEGLI